MYPTHTELIRNKCTAPNTVIVQLFDVVAYLGHDERGFFYVRVLKSKNSSIIGEICTVKLSDFAPLQPPKRIYHDA